MLSKRSVVPNTNVRSAHTLSKRTKLPTAKNAHNPHIVSSHRSFSDKNENNDQKKQNEGTDSLLRKMNQFISSQSSELQAYNNKNALQNTENGVAVGGLVNKPQFTPSGARLVPIDDLSDPYHRALSDSNKRYLEQHQAWQKIKTEITKMTKFSPPDNLIIPDEDIPSSINFFNKGLYDAVFKQRNPELGWYRFTRIMSQIPDNAKSLYELSMYDQLNTLTVLREMPSYQTKLVSYHGNAETYNMMLICCINGMDSIEHSHHPELVSKVKTLLSHEEYMDALDLDDPTTTLTGKVLTELEDAHRQIAHLSSLPHEQKINIAKMIDSTFVEQLKQRYHNNNDTTVGLTSALAHNADNQLVMSEFGIPAQEAARQQEGKMLIGNRKTVTIKPMDGPEFLADLSKISTTDRSGLVKSMKDSAISADTDINHDNDDNSTVTPSSSSSSSSDPKTYKPSRVIKAGGDTPHYTDNNTTTNTLPLEISLLYRDGYIDYKLVKFIDRPLISHRIDPAGQISFYVNSQSLKQTFLAGEELNHILDKTRHYYSNHVARLHDISTLKAELLQPFSEGHYVYTAIKAWSSRTKVIIRDIIEHYYAGIYQHNKELYYLIRQGHGNVITSDEAPLFTKTTGNTTSITGLDYDMETLQNILELCRDRGYHSQYLESSSLYHHYNIYNDTTPTNKERQQRLRTRLVKQSLFNQYLDSIGETPSQWASYLTLINEYDDLALQYQNDIIEYGQHIKHKDNIQTLNTELQTQLGELGFLLKAQTTPEQEKVREELAKYDEKLVTQKLDGRTMPQKSNELLLIEDSINALFDKHPQLFRLSRSKIALEDMRVQRGLPPSDRAQIAQTKKLYALPHDIDLEKDYNMDKNAVKHYIFPPQHQHFEQQIKQLHTTLLKVPVSHFVMKATESYDNSNPSYQIDKIVSTEYMAVIPATEALRHFETLSNMSRQLQYNQMRWGRLEDGENKHNQAYDSTPSAHSIARMALTYFDIAFLDYAHQNNIVLPLEYTELIKAQQSDIIYANTYDKVAYEDKLLNSTSVSSSSSSQKQQQQALPDEILHNKNVDTMCQLVRPKQSRKMIWESRKKDLFQDLQSLYSLSIQDRCKYADDSHASDQLTNAFKGFFDFIALQREKLDNDMAKRGVDIPERDPYQYLSVYIQLSQRAGDYTSMKKGLYMYRQTTRFLQYIQRRTNDDLYSVPPDMSDITSEADFDRMQQQMEESQSKKIHAEVTAPSVLRADMNKDDIKSATPGWNEWFEVHDDNKVTNAEQLNAVVKSIDGLSSHAKALKLGVVKPEPTEADPQEEAMIASMFEEYEMKHGDGDNTNRTAQQTRVNHLPSSTDKLKNKKHHNTDNVVPNELGFSPTHDQDIEEYLTKVKQTKNESLGKLYMPGFDMMDENEDIDDGNNKDEISESEKARQEKIARESQRDLSQEYPVHERLAKLTTLASHIPLNYSLQKTAIIFHQQLIKQSAPFLRVGLPPDILTNRFSDEITGHWAYTRKMLFDFRVSLANQFKQEADHHRNKCKHAYGHPDGYASHTERAEAEEYIAAQRAALVGLTNKDRPESELLGPEIEAGHIAIMAIDSLVMEGFGDAAKVIAKQAYDDGVFTKQFVDELFDKQGPDLE